jgi:type I restriction enzyme M protein
VINDEGETDKESITYNRPDFWTTTFNKQLNFLQHVKSMLQIPGRAAVVVPDNVLFEGGAGEKLRRKLLQECEVHTLLRLPTGIFYSQGVKANVIFFERKPGAKQPWTKHVWIYDLRTNKEFTLKERRLVRADLYEFVECYHPENRHQRKPTWDEKKNAEGRWRMFTYEEIVARDKRSLDIFWVRDESLEDSSKLPPHLLAAEIAEDLRNALEQIESVLGELQDRAARCTGRDGVPFRVERAVVESATISEARAGMLVFVVTTRAFRPTKPSTTDAGSALNSLEELPESNAC